MTSGGNPYLLNVKNALGKWSRTLIFSLLMCKKMLLLFNLPKQNKKYMCHFMKHTFCNGVCNCKYYAILSCVIMIMRIFIDVIELSFFNVQYTPNRFVKDIFRLVLHLEMKTIHTLGCCYKFGNTSDFFYKVQIFTSF